MAFSVLFVCTANICRSVMAERLFRAAIDPSLPIVASSAGTNALDGHDTDGPTAAAITELGGDPTGHEARQVTAAMIEQADLVLTATSAHRARILQDVPMAFRRVFTLREFARLVRTSNSPSAPTENDLRARVAEAAGMRGIAETPAPGADEVGDPYGAPYAEVQACALRVRDAVNDVISGLGLTPAR